MARYLFTGDGPEIFPSFSNPEGSTLVLYPGDEADLPAGVVHARLQLIESAPPVDAEETTE